MKCDVCGQEATVHEQTIRAGKVSERHLCEKCARDAGVSVQSHAPLTSLLSQFITTTTAQGATVVPAQQCPSCGLAFAKFKESGLLGCPDCYAAFEQPLSSLLERAHEGGTHHCGKKPRRLMQRIAAHAAAPPSPAASPAAAAQPQPAEAAPAIAMSFADRQKRITALRKSLAEAVKAEQYERAAQLRDELRRLGDADAPPTDPGRRPGPGGKPPGGFV